jgi:flagellar biosynthesis protein FliR
LVISIAQAQLFFLALTRVLAILIQVPVLAGSLVPNQIKIGLGILLTMVLIPWNPLPAEAASMPILVFGFAIGRELLLGTLAGFSAALTFSIMQIAAEMMGLGSGFASGKILNPALDASGSAYDQFFIMTTMLIFLVVNGHHTFILGIKRTFDLIPVNSALPNLSMDGLISMTAGLIAVGLQLSLPVMGALMLTDLTLGLLARVAPQVQVFFLGVPIKVAVGLIGLALVFGVLMPTLADLFQQMGARMLQLLGG